jgi:hypothetical protein
MLNPTKHTLQKLELLFEELGYAIRYEKGNFQSGYCVVEHRSVAVINKFFDVEARISTLLDILDQIEVEEESLSDKSRKLWRTVQAIKAGNTTTEADEEPITEPEAPLNPPQS